MQRLRAAGLEVSEVLYAANKTVIDCLRDKGKRIVFQAKLDVMEKDEFTGTFLH